MADERIVIEEGKDPMPENLFDGKVRTIKYLSGMEMTVGRSRDLDHIFPPESPEEIEARLEREGGELPTREEMVRQGIMTREEAAQDPLERWLS